MTDKAENSVEILLKVKERKLKPKEITFSDELSKLFPEPNEKIAEQEEKINDLPPKNIGKTFSKIDKGRVPKELKFFIGGLSNEFKNSVRSLGVSASSNKYLDFLKSEVCADLMKANRLKVHLESGNIYHNITNTNESIYSFFDAQKDKTKKWIDFDFILSDDYNNYFMKYLINIKVGKDKKYDMLANKNWKFLFYHFNDYLKQINEPTKPMCHTIVTDDETALEILQSKNWQHFIERILELCQSNNGGGLRQLFSGKESLTICKSFYTL